MKYVAGMTAGIVATVMSYENANTIETGIGIACVLLVGYLTTLLLDYLIAMSKGE